MKITKETFKLQTALFIFITLFIVCFKTVFGGENTLIGVTTVTAALMLLSRDFTLNPLRNTLMFLGVNVLIGAGTLLASSNMYLGIFINFGVLFTICYIFCDNLRNPIYVPFALQYLFVLSNPVSGNRIWIRFAALIVGALIIMLLQLLANQKKLVKSGNAILINICDLILKKFENTPYSFNNEEISREVVSSMNLFREMIYDKREYNYYLTEEARIKLNISVSLENINSILSSKNIALINKDILDTLKVLIKQSKSILNNSKEDKHNASNHMSTLLKICEDKQINDLLDLQLLDSMLLLSDNLDSLKNLDVKKFNFVDKTRDVGQIFTESIFKSIFADKKSLKFCYAMRLSITISIGAFIMDYFKLTDGRWILFTILSLTNPLYEVSKSKTKDRLIFTAIGCIIVYILLSIFNSTSGVLLVVMVAGYLNGFFNEYKYKMIFTTISAIGSAALAGDLQILTIDRIIFVALGSILAILANNFLFPYSVRDSLDHLRKMYNTTVTAMLTEIKCLLQGNKRPSHMKNLFVTTSLIDSKVRSNIDVSNTTTYNQVIIERRSLVANIYELYILMIKKDINYDTQKQVLLDLEYLIKYSNENISSKVKHLEEGIKISKDINSKIILSSIVVILEELEHLNELNEKNNVVI